MSPRIPAARVHTSEPDQAFRQPPTAWQRDRMGRVKPMRRYYWPLESHGELPVGKWEGRLTMAIVALAPVVVAAIWAVRS